MVPIIKALFVVGAIDAGNAIAVAIVRMVGIDKGMLGPIARHHH
jgi:hypothetical protein